MNERDSEQGIQANRPALTDTRITAEEPLPEPANRPMPSFDSRPQKPFHGEHWLGILVASSLVWATYSVVMLFFTPAGGPEPFPAKYPRWVWVGGQILGVSLAGASVGCFIGLIFLVLMWVSDLLEGLNKFSDK
jgi:hypothetical protein